MHKNTKYIQKMQQCKNVEYQNIIYTICKILKTSNTKNIKFQKCKIQIYIKYNTTKYQNTKYKIPKIKI